MQNAQVSEEAKKEVKEACVMDAIKLLQGREPSRTITPIITAPTEAQQVETCYLEALLVIIFIINAVQYCEEEFEVRHP